jgi:hypothetical protein
MKWAGIILLSWFTLVIGLVGAGMYFTRRRPSDPVFACVMCDRSVFGGERVTCSEVCRDMWLGDLGRVR